MAGTSGISFAHTTGQKKAPKLYDNLNVLSMKAHAAPAAINRRHSQRPLVRTPTTQGGRHRRAAAVGGHPTKGYNGFTSLSLRLMVFNIKPKNGVSSMDRLRLCGSLYFELERQAELYPDVGDVFRPFVPRRQPRSVLHRERLIFRRSTVERVACCCATAATFRIEILDYLARTLGISTGGSDQQRCAGARGSVMLKTDHLTTLPGSLAHTFRRLASGRR